MKKKRKIIYILIISFTAISLIIGRAILLNDYRQKANVALILSGDYKKAIFYYSKLIWWKPGNSELYFNRGDAYSNDKQYDNAINDYKKSIELGNDNILQKHLRIGTTAKEKGDLDYAETTFQKLLGMSRNSELEYWAANYHLGQISFKKGKYRKAINFYNEAIRTLTTDLNLYHRANAYYAIGLKDSAIIDYNKSIVFVKSNYIYKYPNSKLAECDTCGFAFGSKEYEFLTSNNNETFIEALERVEDPEIKNLNKVLKQIERTSK